MLPDCPTCSSHWQECGCPIGEPWQSPLQRELSSACPKVPWCVSQIGHEGECEAYWTQGREEWRARMDDMANDARLDFYAEQMEGRDDE